MTSRNSFAKATSRDHGGPGIVPIVVRFGTCRKPVMR
jgi:hypothetical protein